MKTRRIGGVTLFRDPDGNLVNMFMATRNPVRA